MRIEQLLSDNRSNLIRNESNRLQLPLANLVLFVFNYITNLQLFPLSLTSYKCLLFSVYSIN